MSEYGEPWQYTDLEGLICIDRANGRPVAMDFDEPDARRAIACVNSLAGIPNPEAVRELIEAARLYCSPPTSGHPYTACDEQLDRLAVLRRSVEALSAPFASPQK